MSDAATYWRKVDDLLKSAVISRDMGERKRLIDDAIALRGKALEFERAKARLEGHGAPLKITPSDPEPV